MASPTDLDADDRLLYLIGVTTRWHVLLEQAAHHVFKTLVAPTPGVYLAPASASQLLTDCKLMLKRADVGDDLRADGIQTLDAALEANQERNRLVHDLYMGSDQEATWTAVRSPRRGQLGGAGRLVSLQDASRDLRSSGALKYAYQCSPGVFSWISRYSAGLAVFGHLAARFSHTCGISLR